MSDNCWACGASPEPGAFREHIKAWKGPDRSWRDIAKLTGVHPSNLSRWMKGKELTLRPTMILCKAAGLNPADFMEEWTVAAGAAQAAAAEGRGA